MNPATPRTRSAAVQLWLLRVIVPALLAGYVVATIYWRGAGRNFIRAGRLATAPTLAAGETLSLRASQRVPAALIWGWSPPQDDANWSYGKRAEIAFRRSAARPPRRAIVVVNEVQFPAGGGAQFVSCTIDGRPAGVWEFPAGTSFPVERVIELLPAAPDSAGLNVPLVLGFEPRTVQVPLQLGRSGDPRQLGIAVREIRFE